MTEKMTAENRSGIHTALILAGGLGTRLKSVVSDRQKAAAEVAGYPFIGYLIRQIADAGIHRIILCAGHKANTLQDSIRGLFPELDLVFSVEKQPLGTAGALRLALDYSSDQEFLVMNGDSYFDVDLADFLKFSRNCSVRAAVCLRKMEDVSRYGRVTASPSGVVLSFEEKGAFSGAGLINAGIYYIRREVLSRIPKKTVCSLEKEIFPVLADRGELAGYPADGTFVDIGTPESYRLAQQIFVKENKK